MRQSQEERRRPVSPNPPPPQVDASPNPRTENGPNLPPPFPPSQQPSSPLSRPYSERGRSGQFQNRSQWRETINGEEFQRIARQPGTELSVWSFDSTTQRWTNAGSPSPSTLAQSGAELWARTSNGTWLQYRPREGGNSLSRSFTGGVGGPASLPTIGNSSLNFSPDGRGGWTRQPSGVPGGGGISLRQNGNRWEITYY